MTANEFRSAANERSYTRFASALRPRLVGSQCAELAAIIEVAIADTRVKILENFAQVTAVLDPLTSRPRSHEQRPIIGDPLRNVHG
jgi:hypothetical protein